MGLLSAETLGSVVKGVEVGCVCIVWNLMGRALGVEEVGRSFVSGVPSHNLKYPFKIKPILI